MTMGNKELIATAGVGERVESGQFDLLLGAWCCAAGHSSSTSAQAEKVIPYHWDDRAKLYQDSKNWCMFMKPVYWLYPTGSMLCMT